MNNENIIETEFKNKKERIFEENQNIGWAIFYLIIANVMTNIAVGIIIVIQIMIKLVKAIM